MSIITNFIDIFVRASKKQALTVQQRAFLKAIFGFFVGIMGSLVPQLPGLLAGTAVINIGWTLGCIVVVVLCLMVAKLWDASTPADIAIGQLMEYYAEEIEAIIEGELAVKQLPKYFKKDDHKTEPLPEESTAV